MKRALAILGLTVFLGGFLVLPLAHHLAEAGGGESCAHGHCPSHSAEEGDGESRHGEGAPVHHASACSICQLAKAAFDGPVAAAMPAPSGAAVVGASAVPSQRHVASARRLPFSCGPPA